MKYTDWTVQYLNEDTEEAVEFQVRARTLVEAGRRGSSKLEAWIRKESFPFGYWWLRPGYPMPSNIYEREGSQN